MKKYLSMAVLCMSLLNACGNNDKNEDKSSKEIIKTKEIINTKKVVNIKQTEASLELILPINFTTVKKRNKSFDQLHFYFSKKIIYTLKIMNEKNEIVSEHETTKFANEFQYNLGLKEKIDYGVYNYVLEVSTKDDIKKTYEGSFEKKVEFLFEAAKKITDISLSANEELIYVAEQAASYMDEPKLYSISLVDKTKNDIVFTDLPASIYDIEEYKGKLFIAGSKGMGSNLLISKDLKTNEEDNVFKDIQCSGYGCYSVFSIKKYKDSLYIGTDKGLYKLSDDNTIVKITDHLLDADEIIKSLYVDSKGYLWITSMDNAGVSYFDGTKWTSLADKLSAGGYIDIVEGDNGDYWLAGNTSGLTKYNINDKSIKTYTPYNSDILDHNIISVAYNGKVIVGSHDYGFSTFDKSSWVKYDKTNTLITGMTSDMCYSNCAPIQVAERMIQSKDKKVFVVVSKSLFEIH